MPPIMSHHQHINRLSVKRQTADETSLFKFRASSPELSTASTLETLSTSASRVRTSASGRAGCTLCVLAPPFDHRKASASSWRRQAVNKKEPMHAGLQNLVDANKDCVSARDKRKEGERNTPQVEQCRLGVRGKLHNDGCHIKGDDVGHHSRFEVGLWK